MEVRTDLYLGDSREELKKLDDNSVDLIVTSPPYADHDIKNQPLKYELRRQND